MLRKLFPALLLCLVSNLVLSPATAQSWPAKPVRITVGASAGGGTDIIARILAEKYQGVFGQPFIVENRPGAANTIAAELTAKATPDGHTLLLATNTAQAIAPHLMKLRFDPIKDLIPVALIVVVPNVVVVGPQVAASNINELVALMKAKRAAELPNVPTLAEAGVRGVEMTTWYGLFVTAGAPKETVARLYAETMKILKLPDVEMRLVGLGGEPGNLTSEQFAALNKFDFDRFGKLIRDADIKIEQ